MRGCNENTSDVIGTLNMDEVIGHIHSCVLTDLNISEKGTGVTQKPRPVVQKQYPIPIPSVAKNALLEQLRDVYAQIGYYQGEFLTLALSPVWLKSVWSRKRYFYRFCVDLRRKVNAATNKDCYRLSMGLVLAT